MSNPLQPTAVQRLRKTIDSRVPDPITDWSIRLGKFTTCAALGMALWAETLNKINGGSSIGSTAVPDDIVKVLLVAALFLGPGLAAGVVHSRLPTQTVDNYHRFGKSAALFVAVNVTVSLAFIGTVAHSGLLLENGNTLATDLLMYWALASMFIPGPYVGVLAAARWIND